MSLCVLHIHARQQMKCVLEWVPEYTKLFTGQSGNLMDMDVWLSQHVETLVLVLHARNLLWILATPKSPLWVNVCTKCPVTDCRLIQGDPDTIK